MKMTHQEIVHEVKTLFEEMLKYVTEDTETENAHTVERTLWGKLLALGSGLLSLYFMMRSEKASRAAMQLETGSELKYVGERKRDYYSVFGKIAIWRPYFYKNGEEGGRCPLDAEMGLGAGSYSDMLQQMMNQLSVYVPYARMGQIVNKLLGIQLSTRVGQAQVGVASEDVVTYYAQMAEPAPVVEATILVAQADGKGVPIRQKTAAADKVRLGKGEKRSCKKEAVVTSTYTIAPKARTASDVVASLFNEPSTTAETSDKTVQRPQHKRNWATLEGKHVARQRLQQQVAKLENPCITERVALCDGDPALQDRMQTYLPNFTLILDVIHLSEYLWKVANAMWPQDENQRLVWVKQQLLALLLGQAEEVLSTLHTVAQSAPSANKLASIMTTHNYLKRNLPFVNYAQYLSAGWPIASGVIEGACRHLVKDRMELSGMRWHPNSADSLLALRAVSENGDWDAYHLFHQQKRQTRLYHAYPEPIQHSAFHSLPLVA